MYNNGIISADLIINKKMAITSSTIRIYSDEDLNTLVKTVTTQGADNSIDITDLSEGTTYWATVQVTENSMTSEESDGYQFSTIPDCEFYENPTVSGTTIFFHVYCTTDDVGIQKSGIAIGKTDDTFSRPTLVTLERTDWSGSVTGLDANTSYTLMPYVMDEYGRVWYNTYVQKTLTTSVLTPVVKLSDITASSNSCTGTVVVTSKTALIGLTIRLLPAGGSEYITATGYTAKTGTQSFTATGLTAGTTYTVYATAVNGGGSTTVEEKIQTKDITATVSLDEVELKAASPTDTVSVEASGSVGIGATVNSVGVRLFADNSTSSTIVGEAYGEEGAGSVAADVTDLPAGTTLYAFAFLNYSVDSTSYTIYSAGSSVLTVPTMTLDSQNVGSDYCEGTFTVVGTDIDSVNVKYKAENDNEWTNAKMGSRTYSIGYLTAGTTYSVVGEVTNASGTYTTPESTFTPVAVGTATFTDSGSDWLTSSKGYSVDYSVTTTYAIAKISVIWSADESFPNGNTGSAEIKVTENQTTHAIETTINNHIPSSGKQMYIKILVTDTYGTEFYTKYTVTVPTQTLTVSSRYVENGNDFVFTATVESPEYAINSNSVSYTGSDNKTYVSSKSAGLSSVTLTLNPDEYAIKHYVEDIYGNQFGYDYVDKVYANAPMITDIKESGTEVGFVFEFPTAIPIDDAFIEYNFVGNEEIIQKTIDYMDDSTWVLTELEEGEYEVTVNIISDGQKHTSSKSTFKAG